MWNNRILIAATYLDPFKKEFEFFNNLSGHEPNEYITKPQDFIKARYTELIPISNMVDEIEDVTPKPNQEHQKRNYGCFMQKNSKTKVASSSRPKSIDEELAFFDVCEPNPNENFAKFWRRHQELYPKLALMVKSICCGPSTTVASESDFSMDSDFVWAKRNRLSARRLQHLTFVKRQLQKEI